MTPKTSSALAEYLDREYRKRSAENRNFSLRQWASEIDIDESLLNRMINGRNSGPKQISIEVLNKLLLYFGPEMLIVLGIALPDKPRNPMYSPPTSAGLSVAEKRDQSYGSKKEGK